jgi:uncharacterized membrane protein
VVEVGQSSDGIGWVAGLMVWGVAEAAFWPWLMGFLRFMMGEACIFLEMAEFQKNTIDLSKW